MRYVVIALICTNLRAQTPPAKPQFEVASIKLAAPDARGNSIRTASTGRLDINNYTLSALIVSAYEIQPFQISGGPSWLDSERYDIAAKSEQPPKKGELNLMLQTLLADRFQLKFHRTTKELPVYALVPARKDGKLGPRLKSSDCVPAETDSQPSPKSGQPATLGCGGMLNSDRQLTAGSIPLASLVSFLSRNLSRTVLDKTGLSGNFDMFLEWTPDQRGAVQLPPEAPIPPSYDTTAPSIFTALQQQLGLKLESQRGPVEIFVIDRVDKPSEN